ncbi:sigma factor-like helix-turn-helix DNA-binding protein [Streptomyces sp. NPDC020794]|jgi:RNA polymerase sigma factor (sigma-70 family)|uniref:sigma factor-like helix-turn-helix DNA-binding protein n=1 Tax=unclassified Streptomyces TaxID=2593676 RepID=UPI0036E8E3B7
MPHVIGGKAVTMVLWDPHAYHPSQTEGDSTGRWGDGTSMFVGAAPRLLAIGLGILHDAGDAEDVVQEAWLRWARTDQSVIVNPTAFLALTTSRLALNVSQSARRRREILAGPALPECADHAVTPEAAVERHEAVDIAIRLLMERLPPTERAVYLLRTAFDHPYARISEMFHLTESYARQLLHRGRMHLTRTRLRPVDTAAHRRLVRTFLAAADTLDLAELEELLIADATRGRRLGTATATAPEERRPPSPMPPRPLIAHSHDRSE